MALIAWNGFDNIAAQADLQAFSGVVQYTGGGSTTTGRNGNGKAWNGNLTATLNQRLSTLLVAASLYMTAETDVSIYLNDTIAAATQIFVVFRARNYSVEVWRGNTILSRSGNNVWAAQVNNSVEVKSTIDNSAGSVAVKVNDVAIASAAVSGADTQNTANAWIDQISITGAVVDDFHVMDSTTGTGSHACADFLGVPRVYTLFPNANAAAAFTPLSNTNYQEVNEASFNGDTSYNSSSTVGAEDLFTFSAPPTSINTILGVQMHGAYRKDDAGSRSMKTAIKSGSTEVYGASHSLPDGSYARFCDQWYIDPAGAGDFTYAIISALEGGYAVAA